MARLDRETRLKEIVEKHISVADKSHPKPTLDHLRDSGLHDEVTALYKQLGGIMSEAPCNVGPYDIQIENCIIELDEEAHFNRYRAITLNSPFYQNAKTFSVENYKRFCEKFETTCLRDRGSAGFWSNDSSDRQFGISSPPKDLSGNGSSRWKQRAFYDFLKDTVSKLHNINVIRLSVYDKMEFNDERISVNTVLINNNSVFDKLLANHIAKIMSII